MASLKRAIIGNAEAISGGKYIDKGYEGDVGNLPVSLVNLTVKPGSISAYNKLTGIGWNGPYIDSTEGSYLIDAWGAGYVYQSGGRRLISVGGNDSIIVNF
jgi:hypothetical protein